MAFRSLRKQKVYSFINILGLAVGISATILILFYLRFEWSYDNFHEDSKNIYRVSIKAIQEGKIRSDSHVYTPPIGPAMKKDFPEVLDYTRFSTRRIAYLQVGDSTHKVIGFRYADTSLLNFFTFKTIAGNPDTALEAPYSIVITEKTASQIFGSKDPLGEIVKIGPKDIYQVTGVVEDPPLNSTIQFSVLSSFSSLYEDSRMHMDWNGGNQYITYVRLRDKTDPAVVEEKFPDFMWKYINKTIEPYGWKNEPYLQALKKIHFHHDKSFSSALSNFYNFSAIALFILVIACINFVNLTTARAAGRAREVGLRKVVGANRKNLIRQFLGESLFLTFVAFVTGLLLVLLLTPVYNKLLGRDFSFLKMLDLSHILGMTGLILIVSIVSGIYPAFYLSSFQPVKTLKGVFKSGRENRKFRNVLVIFQFAISVALIICTLLIQSQLRFMKRINLGFNKDNTLVVPLADSQMRKKTEEIRSELLRTPGILDVSASSEVPYNGFTSNGYIPEGYQKSIMIHVVDIDEEFLKNFDIPVVQGRNFSKEFSTDKTAYLINETLAKELNWEDSIGKTITRNGIHTVIGVVKDFKFATLHNRIEPLILTNRHYFRYLSVKTNSNDLGATLGSLQTVYKKFAPTIPFEYWFLDEAFDGLYKSEQRFQKIFLYFSSLAIFIALLGLFSLSSYSAQQKSKEIGIRKVLGASIPNILSIFSKELIYLILAANLVAWPVSFYIFQKWLENFAYRANVNYLAFLLALVGSLTASLITISFQSVKAACRNPVDELRSE